MQTLKGHRGKVRSLSFSPDGVLLASCGGHAKIAALWQLEKGQCSYLKGHDDTVHRVRFAPQEGLLLSGQYYRNLLWFPSPTGTWASQVVPGSLIDFVAGGQALACLDGIPQVRYLNPRTLEDVRPALPFAGHNSFPLFAGSPTSLAVALTWHDWRLKTNHLVLGRPEQASPLLRYSLSSIPYALRFSPDGNTVATGTTNSLQRFDVSTGEELPRLRGHTRMVTGLAFLPDGRLLSCSMDGTVRTWDHDSAKCLDTRDWQMGYLTALTVAPDGMRAAVGSGSGEILIWDLD